jgi:hypothetical protein
VDDFAKKNNLAKLKAEGVRKGERVYVCKIVGGRKTVAVCYGS